MDYVFSILSTFGPWTLLGLFVAAMIGWEVWQSRIRPMLIPQAKIDAMVDALIARYGTDAEEMAFGEEDRAWRYSDTFKQGVLRRVRRELHRRHRAGEWD